ncbi:MAG: sulfite exporter TauE/SafE family protein [Archaeoglobaceae archaeon]|nr:sulfite exporter TauE/SafE family protein [Archaeoglobaceae archaeon]
MEIITVISLFITGIVAGTFGGLLGLGGGFIMLPALSFLFDYPLTKAVGTTITAVVFTAFSGTLRHLKMKNVDLRTAKLISLTGSLGAIAGSLSFLFLSERLWFLNLLMGIVFLYTSLRMLKESLTKEVLEQENELTLGFKREKVFLGFFVGLLVGLLGLGGGFILVPGFVYIFGFTMKLAVGTSLASFLSMATVSSLFKLYQGVVDILAVLFLGFGAMIGAQLGAKLLYKTTSRIIKALFGLTFLYISMNFLLRVFTEL